MAEIARYRYGCLSSWLLWTGNDFSYRSPPSDFFGSFLYVLARVRLVWFAVRNVACGDSHGPHWAGRKTGAGSTLLTTLHTACFGSHRVRVHTSQRPSKSIGFARLDHTFLHTMAIGGELGCDRIVHCVSQEGSNSHSILGQVDRRLDCYFHWRIGIRGIVEKSGMGASSSIASFSLTLVD